MSNMKKCFLTLLATLMVVFGFAQGSAEMGGFVPSSVTSNNISASVGQTFYQLAPADAPISLVTEGLQQATSVESSDTLLLYASEMGNYSAGNNEVESTTPEGYDELIHRQVYELTCPEDYEHTMDGPGALTYNVTLNAPTVSPNDGKVQLILDRDNPYDYPVGDTTTATWTASVAEQQKSCDVAVIINNFNCASVSPITDYEGHEYPVVGLGNFCWMAKNLRAEIYGDGTAIPNVMTLPANLFPEITNIVEELGHLYTWDAATNYNTAFGQGACPEGWHIPTEEEMNYVLTQYEATSLMTEDYWVPTGGTDDYGFSVLPGGYYNAASGNYERALINSYFWTVKEAGMVAISCMFGEACSTMVMGPEVKENGFSVRCVMNY